MIKYILIVLVIFLCGCDIKPFMVESNLKISGESRAPKWFAEHMKKGEKYNFRITLYSVLKNDVKAELYRENVLISTAFGNFRWAKESESQIKEIGKELHYPVYFIITINNIPELFVQKEKGDTIYIIDTASLGSAN